MTGMFILILVIVAFVVLPKIFGRVVRRRDAHKDAVLMSREDRTAPFPRTPGHFRGRPGL